MTTTRPYLSWQVTLTVRGQRLGGLAYAPHTASSTPAPLAICRHGMESSHTRVAPMARYFATAGTVAICFDFRGSGGSANQGETTTMSALIGLADLEAILIATCTWPEVGAPRVALFGLSLGGAVAAFTAVRHPQRITALALQYPALRLGENLRTAFHTLVAIPEEFDWAGTRLGCAYAVDGQNLEVGAELAIYRRPVLIIYEDQGHAVPIEISRAAVSITPGAELVTIPGATHSSGDTNWEETVRRTIDFLAWNGVPEED